MGLFDRFRRRPAGSVVVPEGHEVIAVGPAPEPCVVRMKSGALVADFGPQLAAAAVFDEVERHLRGQPQTMVVWFVGPAALPLLLHDVPVLIRWLHSFHAVRSVRGPGVRGDVVVVPANAGPEARALMSLVRALDIGVHQSAPDGVGFIEVHRPDGITVGMAGEAFADDEEPAGQLSSLFERVGLLGITAEAAEDGRALRRSVVRLVQQQRWRAGIRDAAGLPTPLSDLLTRATADPEAMPAFEQAFLRARVGVPLVEVPADADGAFHSTPDRPVMVIPGQAPDGRMVVLACADREVFVQRFDPGFNAEMLGRDVARMALESPGCEGLMINSAAGLQAIILDRARLSALLQA